MGFRSEKERKRQRRAQRAISRRNPGKSGFVTGRSRGRGRTFNPRLAGPGGAPPGQPFPKSDDPNIGVITSAPRTPPRQPTPTPQRESIITGGTPDERRSVQIAESALDPSQRKATGQSNFERFCEIKIVKGKRKRVCKVRGARKTKKTKTKTKRKKRDLFDTGFFV